MNRNDVLQDANCLRDQLCRDARAAGAGALAEANRLRIELGLDGRGTKKGAAQYPRTTTNPGLRGLSAVAHGLGTDLVATCARTARYASGPIAEFLADCERLSERRSKKDRRLPRTLIDARKRSSRTLFPHDDYAGVNVRVLNEQRFDRPRAALFASYEALRRVKGAGAVGDVLAVHASNLRECEELEHASLALMIALPAADLAGRELVLARLVHAAAGLVLARGRFTLARGLIDRAEAYYCRCHDRLGRAATMIDRASCALVGEEDSKTALLECKGAIGLLTPSERRQLTMAHQQRAHAFLYRGALDEAAKAAEQALQAVPLARMLRGRIRWLQACIAGRQGDFALASVWLMEAYALVQGPVADRLLIAAQLLRAHLRLGQRTEARAIAKSHLSPLFGPLSKDELAQRNLGAAHATLLRASLEANLSLELVEQAIRAIETGRARRLAELRERVNRRR